MPTSVPRMRTRYSLGSRRRLSRRWTGGRITPRSVAICLRRLVTRPGSSPPLSRSMRRSSAVSDLELDGVDRDEVLQALGSRGPARRAASARRGRSLRARLAARQQEGAQREQAEGDGRHPRHAGQRPQHRRRVTQGARVAEHLTAHLEAQVGSAAGARHHDAGRGRDQQRRHLRHQAVADGEDGERLDGGGQRHVVADQPGQQAAHDVDRRDDEAGDRVAAHELAGAVHRAEELDLALQAPARRAWRRDRR